MIHLVTAEARNLFAEILGTTGASPVQKQAATQLFDDVLDQVLEDAADEREGFDMVEGIAEFLDSVVALDLLVPGVVGQILESQDGEAFEAGLRWLLRVVKPNPERRARRLERKEVRQARRETRRLSRQTRRELRGS